MYYQGYFITDTWQASNKLTVTAGFAGKFPVSTSNAMTVSCLQPGEENPSLKAANVLGQWEDVRGAFDLVNSALASGADAESGTLRLDCAARGPGLPLKLTETVIRTGGGVFFIPANMNFGQGPYGNAANYYNNAQNATIDSSVSVCHHVERSVPERAHRSLRTQPSTRSTCWAGLGGKGHLYQEEAGYTMQWNFTVQHQFKGNLAFEAGYAGLRGKHLPYGVQFNRLDPSQLLAGSRIARSGSNPFFGLISFGRRSTAVQFSAANCSSRIPQYQGLSAPATYGGDSTYHSLQLKAEKRFSAGGTLLGAYTFSKILANVETQTSWLDSATGTAGYQNVYDMRGEKGAVELRLAAAPDRLSTSTTFRWARDTTSWVTCPSASPDRMVSGWGINGVTTFQKGFPSGSRPTPTTTASTPDSGPM